MGRQIVFFGQDPRPRAGQDDDVVVEFFATGFLAAQHAATTSKHSAATAEMWAREATRLSSGQSQTSPARLYPSSGDAVVAFFTI